MANEQQHSSTQTGTLIDPAMLKPPVPKFQPVQDTAPAAPPAEEAAAEEAEEESASNLPAVIPTAEPTELPVTTTSRFSRAKNFPANLINSEKIVLGQDGKAYSIRSDAGNQYVVAVGSRSFNNIIRERALELGINLRKNDLGDINAMLQGYAETAKIINNVWHRVAPIKNGVVIDLGDDAHTHVQIIAGTVEIISTGSGVLFSRSTVSLPMAVPAETGDLNRLKKYLNMHPASAVLLVGWITYVLAHPKQATSKYPILVLNGGQGSGKSSLCNNILSKLIDPSRIGLQLLPANAKDLAIAAQNSHILFYDNIRGFSPAMADILCIAATGGVISSRQLYTDSDMAMQNLHAALVLNGIHSFVNQPDLAQRCLPIHLNTIPEDQRKSDTALVQEFNADLPYILRGLFDLIAEIFKCLSTAQITNPERMVDFVQWLAAMEMAQGVPAGVYQLEYSEALRHGQLDSLQENELAAAILELTEALQGVAWQGTPEELLNELNSTASRGTQRSKDWPLNPIALSKRLALLEAGLRSQGILITFTRGKKRTIRIASSEVNEEK